MINTKRIYTLASANGFTHADVKKYIWDTWGLGSTKDLDKEQYNQLIIHLDKEAQKMADEKKKDVFLGGGKKKSDTWLKVTLKADVLKPEYWEEYEGKKFIRLNINIKAEPDQYGKDVSVTLDTWKPDGNQQPKAESKKPEPKKEIPATATVDDGLPF